MVFEWSRLWFGGLYVLPGLSHVALVGFVALWVVFDDVFLCEQWPPNKFPALMALSQVDLMGYLQMVCIHLMACLIDGKSYTLFACLTFAHGCFGCHCPFCCGRGMRYLPCSSLTPMSSGLSWHVMRTSFPLCTVTLSLVKIKIVSSSAVSSTLTNDVGKSAK